jgi:signal transduction histidine kinase/CheY-like chemotaxis protein
MVRCKQGEATTCARELELLRKDGTRLWAELKCFAVSGNENPSPHVAIQGILVDITGRKRAEEEKAALQRQLALAQKLESVGQLAGGIAHDFNNLLTVINGYSDLLLNRLGEDDPLWKHVAEIRRAGQQGAALTKQLLTFSRGQIVQPKPLCLNDVIAEIESMLRRLMGDDIIVETALDPSLGLVMADPGQLHQVLLNFAANSRDAMPDGGGFRIVTANVEIGEDEVGRMPGLTAGLFVSLQVSDTGTGIPRELQQRIFDPFFTTKGHGKGTGLGLATVYGIVRQNGGVVSVSSEVANGTTFLILLPRIQTPLLDSPAEDSPKALAGKETVLVVEDRAEIRELIAEALREHGYTVWQAARGSEALEISGRRRGPIHLLLTDVTMPHMNGRELAERLRVLRPEVNVLYMSGYAADMSGHVGQPKSGERYIAKPFSINSLLAIVRDILNKAGFETAS